MVSFLTEFGDPALIVPASIVLLGYLFYLKSARAAVSWGSTLLLCAAMTILLKFCFIACGGGLLPVLDIRSPSGHASLATTFYGSCALMVCAEKERAWLRAFVLVGSALLVAAVAASRILLRAHTAAEVTAGFIIGVCCVAWFALRYLDRPMPSLRLEPVILVAAVAALATSGLHFSLETIITRVAQLFQQAVPVCA
jgi:membrane-associated phospholipid phosphatase